MFECSQFQLTGSNMLHSDEYTPTTDSELRTSSHARVQSVPTIDVVRLHFGGDAASGKWRITDMPKDLRREATKHRPADRLSTGHCRVIARSETALRRLKLKKLSHQQNSTGEDNSGERPGTEHRADTSTTDRALPSTTICCRRMGQILKTGEQQGQPGLDDVVSDQHLPAETQPSEDVKAGEVSEQTPIRELDEQRHVETQAIPDTQQCADILREQRENELSANGDRLTGLNSAKNCRKRKAYQSLPKVVYSWRLMPTKLIRSEGADEEAVGRVMRRTVHWTGISHNQKHISIKPVVKLQNPADRISSAASTNNDAVLQVAADEQVSDENNEMDTPDSTAVFGLLPSIDIDHELYPDCAPITFALHADRRCSEADDNARCAADNDANLPITSEPDVDTLLIASRTHQNISEHFVSFQQPESEQRTSADDSCTNLVVSSTTLNTDGVEERGSTMTNSEQSPAPRPHTDDESFAVADVAVFKASVSEDTEEFCPSLVGQQAPVDTDLNGIVFSHSDFPTTTANDGYADWQEIERYIDENFANDSSSDESDGKLVVDVSQRCTPVDEHNPSDTGRSERVSKHVRRRHRRHVRTRVTRQSKTAEKHRDDPHVEKITATDVRPRKGAGGKPTRENNARGLASSDDTTKRGPKAKTRSRKLKRDDVAEASTTLSEDDRGHRVRQRNPSLKGAEYISMEFDAAHRAATRRKKTKKRSNDSGSEKEWKIGKRLLLPAPPKKTKKRIGSKHSSARDELLTRSRARNRKTTNSTSDKELKRDIETAALNKVETGDDAVSDPVTEESQVKKCGVRTGSVEEGSNDVDMVVSNPAVVDDGRQTGSDDIQMDADEQPDEKQMTVVPQPAGDDSAKHDEATRVGEESAEASIQLSNTTTSAVAKEKSAGGPKARRKRRVSTQRSGRSSSEDSLPRQVLALELGPRFNWLEQKINSMQTADAGVGWPVTSSCQTNSSSASNRQSPKPSSTSSPTSSLVPSGGQQPADDRHLATDESATRSEQVEPAEPVDMTTDLYSEPVVPVDLTESTRQTIATVEHDNKDHVSTPALSLTTRAGQSMDSSSALSLTTRADQLTTDIESSRSASAIVRPSRVVRPEPDVGSQVAVIDGDVIRYAAVEAGVHCSDVVQRQSAGGDGLRLSTTGSAMTDGDADDTLKTEYARRYEMYKDLCRLSQCKDEEVAIVDAERQRLRQELLQMENLIRLKHVPQTPDDNQVPGDHGTAFRVNGPAHGHMTTATVVAHADRPPPAHERKVNLTMYSTLLCRYKRATDIQQQHALQGHCVDDVADTTRTSQKAVVAEISRPPVTLPHTETVPYVVQQRCQGLGVSPHDVAVELGRNSFPAPNIPPAVLDRQEPAISQLSHFVDARPGARGPEPVVLRSLPGDLDGVGLGRVGPIDSSTHNTTPPQPFHLRPPPRYPGPRTVPLGQHPCNNRPATRPADSRNQPATATGRVQPYERTVDRIIPPADPAAGAKSMTVDEVTMMGYSVTRDVNNQVHPGVRTSSLPVPSPVNFVPHRPVRPDAVFSRPSLPAPNDGQFHHRQYQQQQQPSHPSVSQYRQQQQQQQQPQLPPHQQSAMPPQYYSATDRSALRAQGPAGVPEPRGARPVLPGHYPHQPRKPSQPAPSQTQLPGPAYHDRVPAGQRHGLRPAVAHVSPPEDILRRDNVQRSVAPPPSAFSRPSGTHVAGFPRLPPPGVPYENKLPAEQQRSWPTDVRPAAGPDARPPAPERDDAGPPTEYRCETCGRPALFVCAACKRVPYCSDDCQATSWRLHHSSVCGVRY